MLTITPEYSMTGIYRAALEKEGYIVDINAFSLAEEGRELLVDNLIISQVDESIFKGFFFLSNNHFPNIINSDLVKVFFDFLYLFLLTKRGVMI